MLFLRNISIVHTLYTVVLYSVVLYSAVLFSYLIVVVVDIVDMWRTLSNGCS